ncbi:type II toxin-antitoxin system RelE/ParE family toxin [Loktanella salsilacus]|uniref:type II toxin-antitoxin system RelE/ParE family toxin n=1 Tax=Loktanella salsilacus TaxID=195913 RepID=UPI003734F7BB
MDAIWDYTLRFWSFGQAETYIREIASDMSLLVRHPEIARERLEIRPPVRTATLQVTARVPPRSRIRADRRL